MLAKLTGAPTFLQLDFIYGQFPPAESSQECQSFQTPFGVSTPNRVQHGATNSVPTSNQPLESQFSHLNLLIWPDYMLSYASDAGRFLAIPKALFHICLDKGLKLKPRKCDFLPLMSSRLVTVT